MTFSTSQYLNLTTLLTINKQQLVVYRGKILVNSEEVLPYFSYNNYTKNHFNLNKHKMMMHGSEMLYV